MKTTNVVSKEYMKLQESIYALYETWHQTLASQDDCR